MEARLNRLENPSKPTVNVVGFQQTLTNDYRENDYDECGQISWVEANGQTE